MSRITPKTNVKIPSFLVSASGTVGDQLPAGDTILVQEFQSPSNPFSAFHGEGKHFTFGQVGATHYMVTHDGSPFPDGGVAPQPTGNGADDGRQNIEAVSFANPEPVWTHVQDYWPAYATTNGFLFWNPDDAGGFAIGNNEILVFRSSGVLNEDPVVGTLNYPGSGPGAGLVGTLIGTPSNDKFGIYNVVTKAWREGPAVPAELKGNKSWGGAWDPATNRAYFACNPRNLICIDLNSNTDITPRIGGAAQSLQFSSVMDNPHTMNWSVPRGFIADGPNGEGKCFWGWDTQNQWVVIVNLTKYHSWNGSSFGGGNMGDPATYPMSRVKKVPETIFMGGQNNTSLVLDLSTDMVMVFGTPEINTTDKGILHMFPRATALTAPIISVPRSDGMINDLGHWKMAQRQYYDPLIQKTFSVGVIDFGGTLPGTGINPYWMIDTKVPSWTPDYNTVQVLCGPAVTNTSKMQDHDPGPGVWNADQTGTPGAKNLQNILNAWNSGYYNPYGTGQFGNYGRAGGGDVDRTGNDVYDLALNFSTPSWRRLINPSFGYVSPPAAGTSFLDVAPRSGEIVISGVEQVGQPFAPHTYDNTLILPPAQSGHTNGAMLWTRLKFFWGSNKSSNVAHKANLGVSPQTPAASAWSRASDLASGDSVIPGGIQGVSVWDTYSKRVLFTATGGSTVNYSGIQQLSSWSAGSGVWSSVGGLSIPGATEMLSGDPTAEWWPEQRLMVVVGKTPTNTFGIQLFDTYSSPNFSAPPLSFIGTPPPVIGEEGWGLCFVPRLRAFFLRVAHSGAFSQTIWRIQPPAFASPNPTKGGTWTITNITMPGVTVDHTEVNGLWKGLRYAEKADCIIWCVNATGNTYVYRPPLT